MSTDLTLSEQMEYARTITAHTRGQSILPDVYRGNPANALVAIGLGQAMGLSPAESLYRINVIEGKPSAAAELIAANVRKAGHVLRVRGDERSCTATVIRSDDPEFEFSVTRDHEWAQRMELAGQDNYRRQPGTMLQWRAITAVARQACPEALYGVQYTPDEVVDSVPDRPARVTLETLRSGPAPQGPGDEPATVEVVDDDTQADDPAARPAPMWAAITAAGITGRDEAREFVEQFLGREIESAAELADDDVAAVIAEAETLTGETGEAVTS